MKSEYVDHMGSDLSVVNAARVSFDKVSEWECECGDLWWCGNDQDGWRCESCGSSERILSDADARLIKYLARNNHWSPFAHTAITLRIGAPVPIRTQCMKHAIGMNINEESRRYISSRPEVFIPDVFRAAPEGNVKQGSGGVHCNSDWWLDQYKLRTHSAVDAYMAMIEDGICPEQARFILPQGCIVNWIWTGNLASFARFYKERTYDKAQQEVQGLAHAVANIIKPLYPHSWAALTEAKE